MRGVSMEERLKRRGIELDNKDNLTFEGVKLKDIAREYKTPCIVYSEKVIRDNCQEYCNAFRNNKINYEVLYAGKAFLVKALCKILDEEGMAIDASSGGEIYTALSADFPASKIYFHGNNKSEDEIRYALKNNVGTIMIDNLCELDLVDKIAKELNKKVNIMV